MTGRREFVQRERVALNMEAATMGRLKAEAKRRSTSVGALIRDAVDKWLSSNGA